MQPPPASQQPQRKSMQTSVDKGVPSTAAAAEVAKDDIYFPPDAVRMHVPPPPPAADDGLYDMVLPGADADSQMSEPSVCKPPASAIAQLPAPDAPAETPIMPPAAPDQSQAESATLPPTSMEPTQISSYEQ